MCAWLIALRQTGVGLGLKRSSHTLPLHHTRTNYPLIHGHQPIFAAGRAVPLPPYEGSCHRSRFVFITNVSVFKSSNQSTRSVVTFLKPVYTLRHITFDYLIRDITILWTRGFIVVYDEGCVVRELSNSFIMLSMRCM